MGPDDIELGEEVEFERHTPVGVALTIRLTGEVAQALDQHAEARGMSIVEHAADVLRRVVYEQSERGDDAARLRLQA